MLEHHDIDLQASETWESARNARLARPALMLEDNEDLERRWFRRDHSQLAVLDGPDVERGKWEPQLPACIFVAHKQMPNYDVDKKRQTP